jgi:hypothetical protein
MAKPNNEEGGAGKEQEAVIVKFKASEASAELIRSIGEGTILAIGCDTGMNIDHPPPTAIKWIIRIVPSSKIKTNKVNKNKINKSAILTYHFWTMGGKEAAANAGRRFLLSSKVKYKGQPDVVYQ